MGLLNLDWFFEYIVWVLDWVIFDIESWCMIEFLFVDFFNDFGGGGCFFY